MSQISDKGDLPFLHEIIFAFLAPFPGLADKRSYYWLNGRYVEVNI